jgi:hypothetical protein
MELETLFVMAGTTVLAERRSVMKVLGLTNNVGIFEGKAQGWVQKSRTKCGFSVFGSACWARTSDPLINSQLLYQLS